MQGRPYFGFGDFGFPPVRPFWDPDRDFSCLIQNRKSKIRPPDFFGFFGALKRDFFGVEAKKVGRLDPRARRPKT
jgi:hypothetical protein